MRDAVSSMSKVSHQILDAVQHLVEVVGELVKLIACAARRDATREVAADNASGCLVDVLDALQYAPTHEDTSRHGECNCQSRTPDQCAAREC